MQCHGPPCLGHARLSPRGQRRDAVLHAGRVRSLLPRGPGRGRGLPALFRRAQLHAVPVPRPVVGLELAPLADRLHRQAGLAAARPGDQRLSVELQDRGAAHSARRARHKHHLRLPVAAPAGPQVAVGRSAREVRVLPDRGHGRVGRRPAEAEPRRRGRGTAAVRPCPGDARGPQRRGHARGQGRGVGRRGRKRGRDGAQHHHHLAQRGNRAHPHHQRLWAHRQQGSHARRIAVADEAPCLRGARLPAAGLGARHPLRPDDPLGAGKDRDRRLPYAPRRDPRALGGDGRPAQARRPAHALVRVGRDLGGPDVGRPAHPRLELFLHRRRRHQRQHADLDAQHHLRQRHGRGPAGLRHPRRLAQPQVAHPLCHGRHAHVPGRPDHRPAGHQPHRRLGHLRSEGRRRHLDRGLGPAPRSRRAPAAGFPSLGPRPGQRPPDPVPGDRPQRADGPPPRARGAPAGPIRRRGGLPLRAGAAVCSFGPRLCGEPGGHRRVGRGALAERDRDGGCDGVEPRRGGGCYGEELGEGRGQGEACGVAGAGQQGAARAVAGGRHRVGEGRRGRADPEHGGPGAGGLGGRPGKGPVLGQRDHDGELPVHREGLVQAVRGLSRWWSFGHGEWRAVVVYRYPVESSVECNAMYRDGSSC